MEDELCSNRERCTLLQGCGFEDTHLEKQIKTLSSMLDSTMEKKF